MRISIDESDVFGGLDFNAARKEIDKRIRVLLLRETRAAAQRLRRQVPRRTGALAKSVESHVVTGSGRSNVTIGSRGELGGRLRLLDEGGIVRPNRGKFLAIPVGDNLRGGVPQYSSPRDVPFDTFVKFGSKGASIFGRTEGGGDPQLLFVLRKQVTIKGKHFMKPVLGEFVDDITTGITKIVGEVL